MRHTTIAAVAGAAGILLSAFFASCTIKTVPGDERPRSLERPRLLLSSQALQIPEINQAHASVKDTVRKSFCPLSRGSVRMTRRFTRWILPAACLLDFRRINII